MTNIAPPPTTPVRRAEPIAASGRTLSGRFLDGAQLLLALALTVAALVWLLRPQPIPAEASDEDRRPPEVVQIAGPRLVRIQTGSKLEKKLQIVAVESADVNTPVLTVTGTVVASLRPGNGRGNDYWQ